MMLEPLNRNQSQSLKFIADSSLGKLAKWLRLAGFDTFYDYRPPDAGRLSAAAGGDRIVLTRCLKVKHRLGSQIVLFIDSDHPIEQVRQVVRSLDLGPGDMHPLTRCAKCNTELQSLPRMDVQRLVPEYIWQNHTDFQQCGRCGRIYWPGSHAERWLALMKQWFENSHAQ